MITGFNTDVEHDGILYHVQTEDKGLDTPLMLTLVYVRGEILASKRVRYDDLIAAGFDEKVLAERLLRQHKLICAAIRSGRLEELKKMSGRDTASRSPKKKKPLPNSTPPLVESTAFLDPAVVVTNEVAKPKPKPKPSSPPSTEQPLPPPVLSSSSNLVTVSEAEPVPVFVPSELPNDTPLHLVLVDEKIYRGGDRIVLRVRVESGEDQRQVIPGAEVIVKVLGSTFRPMIYQAITRADGVASFRTELPHFRSGRAAILIRGTAGGVEAELRRIIQQG